MKDKETIKVILAEDQLLFRTSLKNLFKEWPRFKIVGEASDGRELIDLLKVQPADVVLLDIEMREMDGVSALKIMKQRFQKVKTVMLTGHSDRGYIESMIAEGASGFLLKNCETNQLAEAIIKVHNGENYFMMPDESITHSMPWETPQNNRSKTLTIKETEVLKQICEGRTNKEIARQMNLSSATVDFYKTKIYAKTKCNSAVTLLRYALKNRIIRLDDN